MTVGLAWLAALVAFVYITWRTIDYSAMSEPRKQVLRVIVGIIGIVLLVLLLLGFAGHPLFGSPALFRG